jgi:hypothetical protein
MWLRGKTAVFAALGVLALVPAAGFGQAGPAAPPAGETAPDAGIARPEVPEASPLPPVIPVPPNAAPGMGMGGRDCESERAPGIGV